jgi:hypothetical protein
MLIWRVREQVRQLELLTGQVRPAASAYAMAQAASARAAAAILFSPSAVT